MQSEVRSANSHREALLGTWRMLSCTRTLVDSGEESDAFGPNPIGYVNYAPDGRVMVLVLKSGRAAPAASVLTAPEKVALFDSMFAYCGTYVVDEEKVVHSLDASWNEQWTGTRQTRFLNFEDGLLIYTTSEMTDPMDGQQCTYTVVFEKVK